MSGELLVNVRALRRTADTVTDAIGVQNDFSLSDLCGPSEMYGHDGLHAQFENFCGRLSGASEVLEEDSGDCSEILHDLAQTYHNADIDGAVTVPGADPGVEVVDG